MREERKINTENRKNKKTRKRTNTPKQRKKKKQQRRRPRRLRASGEATQYWICLDIFLKVKPVPRTADSSRMKMLNPSLARFIASPCRRQPFIYSLASPLSILVWLPVLCHHLFFTTLAYIFTSFPQSSNVFYSVLYSPTCFPYFLNLPLSSTVLYILLQFLYSLFYLPPSCILYNLIHSFAVPLSLTISNFKHPFQRLQHPWPLSDTSHHIIHIHLFLINIIPSALSCLIHFFHPLLSVPYLEDDDLPS